MSGDSPYDHFVNGERSALSAEQQSGLQVFRGKGNCTACQAFGAVGAPGVASVTSDSEFASFAANFTGGNTLHRNVAGSGGIGTTNPGQLNLFGDPAAIYAQFRPCVLGVDNNCGGL